MRDVHVLVVTDQGRAPGLLLRKIGQPIRAPTNLVFRDVARTARATRPVSHNLLPGLGRVRKHGAETVLSDLNRRSHRRGAGGNVEEPAVSWPYVLHDHLVKPRSFIDHKLSEVTSLNYTCWATHKVFLILFSVIKVTRRAMRPEQSCQ